MIRTRGEGVPAKDRGVHEVGPFGVGLQWQLFDLRRAHGDNEFGHSGLGSWNSNQLCHVPLYLIVELNHVEWD